MKILVYYEQEFYDLESISYKALENLCKVFEAESKDHFLNQFDSWDYVPRHLRLLSDKIRAGKKTMIWYLPENGVPL